MADEPAHILCTHAQIICSAFAVVKGAFIKQFNNFCCSLLLMSPGCESHAS